MSKTLSKIFIIVGKDHRNYEGRLLGLIDDVGFQGLLKERGLAKRVKTAEAVKLVTLSKRSNKDTAGEGGGLKGYRLLFSIRKKQVGYRPETWETLYDKLLVTSKIAMMDSFTSSTLKDVMAITFHSKEDNSKEDSWLVIEEYKGE